VFGEGERGGAARSTRGTDDDDARAAPVARSEGISMNESGDGYPRSGEFGGIAFVVGRCGKR
jgi:hypothetical protein